MNKSDLLEGFKSLCEYIYYEKKIDNLKSHLYNFSSFLSYAIHSKTYNFVAPFCENKNVLDVGCFLGYGERYLAHAAKRVKAIDNNAKAIKFAQKKYRFDNVEFLETNAQKLRAINESYDVILAFQLIEHIPPKELNGLVKLFYDLLNKNGVLLVVTPNRKFRLLPFQKPFNPEHYQEFSSQSLSKILQKHFSKIEIKGIRAKEWLQKIEQKRIRKSIFNAYLYTPAYRLLNKLWPELTNKLINKFFYPKRDGTEVKREFNGLFSKFSIEDIYLENPATDESIDLFAVCRKE